MNKVSFFVVLCLIIFSCKKDKIEMPPLYASDRTTFSNIEDLNKYETLIKETKLDKLDIEHIYHDKSTSENKKAKIMYGGMYRLLEIYQGTNIELNSICINSTPKSQIDSIKANNGSTFYYNKNKDQEKKDIIRIVTNFNKVLSSIDSLDKRTGQ